MKRAALAIVLITLACGGLQNRADAEDASAVPAADAKTPIGGQTADEAAIRRNAAAYCDAFNSRNAKQLAALWSPEAIALNPDTDEELAGRAAIEACYTGIFAEPDNAKLEVDVKSIEFVSPNVAIEQGTARVIRPDADPEETSYSAVHVKQGGQWMLDRISEQELARPRSSNYERLKPLEWLIGSWVDAEEDAQIQTDCQWTKNKNFMTRAFAVVVGDRIDMSGIQIIGWDGAAKQVRSWVFDSDGGFGEGRWSQEGDKWVIQSTGTLPEGGRTSAVNILKRIDDDSYTWQSVNREAGGEILPNVEEVLIVRAADGDDAGGSAE